MITPTKFVNANQSLIGLGAIVLKSMSDDGNSISSLWDNLKDNSDIFSYERFILTLDMLFIMGLIKFKNNRLKKVKQ